MKSYDVIWIGTGQATGTVIPRLSRSGKTVAIAERRRIGGTCVNFGCTPTKALVASARAAHMARRGPDFGVGIGDVTINFEKVMERQNAIRNGNSESMESWLTELEGVDLFKAQAELEDPHTVRIGDERITGETIVIHTGARPRIPSLPGLDEIDWLDNARLLDLEELPQHLVIVGGSYISMEFAQAFRRFGSEVTVLEGGPQLMFREDADIAEIALNVLTEEGIQVNLNSRVQRVAAAQQGGVEVHFDQKGEKKHVQGSHLLLATGRIPNSDALNLDAVGVETSDRGYISVNATMQTSVSHIYALGDVNGEGAFTHTSVNDGEIFWDHYSGEGDRKLSDRYVTYAMYIDPPLGRVGMNEKEARKSGRNVLMATRPMSRVARAVEKDETTGLIKILVDADTEQFLGATILGVGGDEIISMFVPFMLTGRSYKIFRRSVLTHPTVAELMPWILDDLAPLDE